MSYSVRVQNVFGPIVTNSYLGGCSFTLFFEEAILITAPDIAGAAWALSSWVVLRKRPRVVKRSSLFWLKLLAYSILVGLHIVLLILRIRCGIARTRLTLPTTAISICCFIAVAFISMTHHVGSVRPSTPVSVFLGVSCLLDLPRARSLFFRPGYEAIAILFLCNYFVKLLVFFLELKEKRHLLLPNAEQISAEEAASIFNRVFFVWMNKIVRRGYKTTLKTSSLPSLTQDIQAASRATVIRDKWQQANQSKTNALLWTFLWHHKWQLMTVALTQVVVAGFAVAQPLLMKQILDFSSGSPADFDSKNVAYRLLGAFAILSIGQAIFQALYGYEKTRVAVMFRGSLITMIYENTLCEFQNSSDEPITLISADINRIQTSLDLFERGPASVLQLGVCLWLIYRLLGISVVASVVTVALCFIVSFPVALGAGNAQKPWLEAIDRRLDATSNALGAVKAIRMTGMAPAIHDILTRLRRDEVRASRRHRAFSVAENAASNLSAIFVPLASFAVFTIRAKASHSQTLTEGTAFAALTLFSLLKGPTDVLTDSVEDMQTIINSFARIQNYLTGKTGDCLSEDPSLYEVYTAPSLPQHSGRISPAPLQSDRSVASLKGIDAGYHSGESIIKDINLDIPRSSISTIVGPVGSGKSTLARLLAGIIPHVSGKIARSFSDCAYCPQSPWIGWGTVKSNIVGMSRWDQARYNAVVQACALSTDFVELPDGDQTKTDTSGARLSGGQQKRISVARALFSDKDVLILDDVLAGLDRITENAIIEAVFGRDGLIRRSGRTVILVTSSESHFKYSDLVIRSDGSGQFSTESTQSAQPCTDPLLIPELPTVSWQDETTMAKSSREVEKLDIEEDLDSSHQTGDVETYFYYIQMAGKWTFAIYLAAAASCVVAELFPPIWLQEWTNEYAIKPNERLAYWLGIYGALSTLAALGIVVSDWVLQLILVPASAIGFHSLLLKTTLHAKTFFLTSTAAGTTINRFSEDLELIDDDLSNSLDMAVLDAFHTVISGILVFIGSRYISISLPFCCLLFYAIQALYLPTSRQLRLLDIEARAPLLSRLLEASNYGPCIRAYGWTEAYLQQSFATLHESQKAHYLFKCLQLWLAVVLRMLMAGIGILLVALALFVPGGSTGLFGVALFNIMNFNTSMQSLITEWTQLESSFGAISRVRSFANDAPTEDADSETYDVPENWPSQGAVEFRCVSSSYQSTGEEILKEISFSIAPGEKLGICGRTGSGKSSLISTLLRILEFKTGSILVDGIDIQMVPRQTLRERLNTLPQDAFFLQGSVRQNVDPLNLADDERRTYALKAVHLWDILHPRGGLDADFTEAFLSPGQQQLFCLARAIVRPGKILILDEATSSIDAETDEMMQHLINTKFRDRTIIAVVHKLDTILDYDHVALLEQGRLKEHGVPRGLVDDSSSAFHALYHSAT